MKKQGMCWMPKRFFLIVLLTILIVGTIAAEDRPQDEYYGLYFHQTDKDNFDSPPQMYEEMDEDAALTADSYTAVRRDGQGRITEAVSFLKGKPNYYYRYLYRNGNIIYRGMYAFVDEGEQILTEVVYSYNEDGTPLSTAYNTYDLFGTKKLKFSKIYHGAAYTVYDNRPPEKDERLLREIESLNDEIKELQRLEKRGLLKKILGWD